MGLLTRKEGWEHRLLAVVQDARAMPYVLGVHDCLRFSCKAIEALTGVDFWPRFVGYKTRRAALATIAKIAPTLGDAVSIVLESPPHPVKSARRGDLVLYRDPQGEDHLGICIGRTVAVLEATGLLYLPISDAGLVCSWRIG